MKSSIIFMKKDLHFRAYTIYFQYHSLLKQCAALLSAAYSPQVLNPRETLSGVAKPKIWEGPKCLISGE